MTLFPITRPYIGLSIGHRTLSAVEVRRDWRAGRALRLRGCRSRELPVGLVRPSATEPNVPDVQALSDQIQGLLDGRQSLSVALTLPDLCGRAALFEFETLPQKAAEREALLRWRFQQDLNAPMATARLAYRIFPAASGLARVLAVAVRPDILEQYEQACEQAGLWPVSVGMAGFRLFDLCRAAMKTPARSGEVFFVYSTEGCFVFMAVRGGTPSFLRVKPVRAGAAADAMAAAGQLADELVATLQFYQDLYPERNGEDAPGPVRPLFVVGDGAQLPAMDLEFLNVRVAPLGSDGSEILKTMELGGSVPGCALPALAGVVET
jgi:hypothetical protein